MAPPDIDDIPPLPLPCMAGDRPDGVPHLDEKACGGDNSDEKAAQAYRDVYVRSLRHSPSEDGLHLDHSVPVQLFRQGFPGLTHPFWKIALHADRTVESDFRSGQAFEAAATNVNVEELARRRNHLTLLYPASGSHMTDFLIPLKLIDKGLIRSAEILHTDIDEGALKYVDAYMQFFGRQGIFKEVVKTTETKSPGYEVRYEFKYQGRPISFIFGMNRGGDVYAPDEYLQRADLIVFHDGVYNGPGDPVANAFMKKLDSLSHDVRFGKDRIVLSENQWNCPDDGFVCRVTNRLYVSEPIEGAYGCTKNHSLDVPRYVPIETPEGQVALKKIDTTGGPPTKVHFAGETSPNQAFLLKVPMSIDAPRERIRTESPAELSLSSDELVQEMKIWGDLLRARHF